VGLGLRLGTERGPRAGGSVSASVSEARELDEEFRKSIEEDKWVTIDRDSGIIEGAQEGGFSEDYSEGRGRLPLG